MHAVLSACVMWLHSLERTQSSIQAQGDPMAITLSYHHPCWKHLIAGQVSFSQMDYMSKKMKLRLHMEKYPLSRYPSGYLMWPPLPLKYSTAEQVSVSLLFYDLAQVKNKPMHVALAIAYDTLRVCNS